MYYFLIQLLILKRFHEIIMQIIETRNLKYNKYLL